MSNKEIEVLKQELETIKQEKNQLKNENLLINEKYQALLKQNKTSPRHSNSHSDDFWNTISREVEHNSDYIKSLIADKTLTMFDVNKNQETVLLIASKWGAYDIVQLCLNLGADIHHKDNVGKTALDWSRDGAWYHIEQLLLFAEMNATVGNQIRVTSSTISKQKGIAQNIINELALYDTTTSQFFIDTIVDIMINIINKKQSFSDDLLDLCWQFECNENNNPLDSKLWKCIAKTCGDIITNGNKIDWFWFKQFVIPSTIWFKDIEQRKEQKYENDMETKFESIETSETSKTNEKSYLFYQLLEMVDIEAQNELNKLGTDLYVMQNKSENEWNELITWNPDIEKQYSEYTSARQDTCPNGIQPQYTYNELAQHTGLSATFNAHSHYDYYEYLSQLTLLAHIVDESFQNSVQKMFNIDKHTKTGTISTDYDDEKKGDTINIKYKRGPVKLMDRARAKAENDYLKEQYPSCACILDFNRCSLIFNDISTLLNALKLFVNKIKYFQSGNIIGILRFKNGFKEYVKKIQYSDIKLNVLIKGKRNNLIGEVQFLIKRMDLFKNKAHNLYAIQRQKEFIQGSVSLILPMLLDDNQQLFVSGNMGDIKGICKLIVNCNRSQQDIMKVDEESQESILLNICALGGDHRAKAFKFLKSYISKDLFVQRLFLQNRYNDKVTETAIQYNRTQIIRNIFEMEQVGQKYYNNDNELFRLMICVFSFGNKDTIDYILSKLNISNDIFKKMMSYQYIVTSEDLKTQAPQKYCTSILAAMITNKSIAVCKNNLSMIGEKEIVTQAFVSNPTTNVNIIEYVIWNNNIEMVKYLISLNHVKDKYLNDKDELYRLIFWLFIEGTEKIIDFVLNELNISNETLIKLMGYKYDAKNDKNQYMSTSATEYQYCSILCQLVYRCNSLDRLKKLVSYIGEETLARYMFIPQRKNGYDSFKYCIYRTNVQMIEYILSIDEIKKKCFNDENIMGGIVHLMIKVFDEKMCKYLMNELKLNEKKLKDLQPMSNRITNKTISKLLACAQV
eukprot:333567_1